VNTELSSPPRRLGRGRDLARRRPREALPSPPCTGMRAGAQAAAASRRPGGCPAAARRA